MTKFKTSLRNYETWLKAQLPPDYVIEADLKEKRRTIKDDAFTFLRGTCWRWAEMAPEICKAFADAPVVTALGDAHIENFGLWRDIDSRLVWGVNDFDEAALTPYAYDLIRLCASALLAGGHNLSAREITKAVVDGYRDALDAPRPFILEGDNLWLRDLFAATDEKRLSYWQDLAEDDDGDPPKPMAKALNAALPHGATELRYTRRIAGVGSLGRSRYALTGQLFGAPLAREVKALAPSCWTRMQAKPIQDLQAVAHGPNRAPDPRYKIANGLVIRRLGPDSRKLERKNGKLPLKRKLLAAMGAEIANIHAIDAEIAEKLRQDINARRISHLADAVAQMALATGQDWEGYKAGG